MRLMLVGLVLVSCSKKAPTAMEACQKLVEAGVAANCHDHKPGGLAANARRGAEFDLPSVPGKTGAVWTFDEEAAFDSTVQSYDNAKVMSGPHRYGNRKAMVFTQMNSGLSMELGDKAKAAIADL
jgi:hypothetical protein